MVAGRSAVGDDQRDSAGARLGRDHAIGLGFAAVNQGIRAGDQAGEFAPILDGPEDAHRRASLGEHLEPLTPRTVADEKQAGRPPAGGLVHRLDDHVPSLFGREPADAHEQRRIRAEPERMQGRAAQSLRSQRG